MKINMPALRKQVLPFLVRMNDMEKQLHVLHQYSKREDYFFHHSIAVSVFSTYVGKKMGFKKGEWLQIGIAGLLSNRRVGKTGAKWQTHLCIFLWTRTILCTQLSGCLMSKLSRCSNRHLSSLKKLLDERE
ncbi:hypothetical protein [Virgibacillus kimchii]